MKTIRTLLYFKWIFGSCIASMAIVIGGMLWGYAALSRVSRPLILRFDNYSGIGRIGTVHDILSIGALGLFMIAIDAWIAFTLARHESFLGNLFAAAAFFIALLLFVAFAAIINVN